MPVAPHAPPVLAAKGLVVEFRSRNWFGRARSLRAVDQVHALVRRGQTLGIVGESGSGKTTLAMAVLRLLASDGEIRLEGEPIQGLRGKALRSLRDRMQIVFQDPYGSLPPRLSVRQIIEAGLKVHRRELSALERREEAERVLADVGLDPQAQHRYPHEFSGGQRQRIAIARAIVLNPMLVVLDEPTSALDVSVQAQIIDLLRDLQRRLDLAYVFISHDLKVVRAIAHDLVVMRDGRVVERGPADDLFEAPRTDYTKALMAAAFELETFGDAASPSAGRKDGL